MEFSAFSAGLFNQMDIRDHHALVDGLAHVIHRQQSYADAGQCFHLHAGLAMQ